MITNNLFNRILIDPVQRDCNKLLIVSGYATSAMAFHHLTELNNIGRTDIDIKLIVGMSSAEGISISNHNGFKQIVNDFGSRFQCSYRTSYPPAHSKMYVWLSNDEPRLGFLGSANYTQTAFNERRQKEILTECNHVDALAYYESMVGDSIYCEHPDSENLIQIFNDRVYRRKPKELVEVPVSETTPIFQPDFTTLESVTVSLLDRNENIHNKGGLNWGQRDGRERNQAYIQLPPYVYQSDFFPIKSTHFTVLTDDNKTLICTRAQKNDMGAAIETPQNNSLLGEYFRHRLGLANGAFITKEDLLHYGRTDVSFYKIDDENYYMDFSIH
ncbi:MAG: NgoFVII family restriction endonuclease [Melioribacteraceae bacterium]|nr:NgoFVII family restriction endonuclease [Melioribacteraceae bacterium]